MKRKFKITFNSPMVLWIIIISFVATLAGQLTNGQSNTLFFATYHSSLSSPMTWIRAFTYIFGHEGWSHFIGNMTYLLLLGPMLEEKYHTKTLAWVVAITALATSLFKKPYFCRSYEGEEIRIGQLRALKRIKLKKTGNYNELTSM